MCPGSPALTTEKWISDVVRASLEQWRSIPIAYFKCLGKFFKNTNAWNASPKIPIEFVRAWSSGFPGNSTPLRCPLLLFCSLV